MSNYIVDIDRALSGDLWVVQETEQLQRTFTKMVGGLVNDSEDVWVKGPAKVQQRSAKVYKLIFLMVNILK